MPRCLALLLLLLAAPAYASPFDEVQKEIFDETGNQIKPELRHCNVNADCTSVASLCRWRPVNVAYEQQVAELSSRITLECKWPGLPPQKPVTQCVNRLCEIPTDGKYY